MKNDDFNIWRDLFGYHDMDFDGDVDFEDVDIAKRSYRWAKNPKLMVRLHLPLYRLF